MPDRLRLYIDHCLNWAVLPLKEHPGVIRLKIHPATHVNAIDILLLFLRIERRAVEVNDQTETSGEATILVGNSSVMVENPLIKPNSRIFVSFYGNTEGAWWISEKVDGRFTVSLQALAATDLKFEYWRLGLTDNRTPPAPPAPEEPTPEVPTDPGTTPPEDPSTTPPVEEEPAAPAEEPTPPPPAEEGPVSP